MSRRDKRIKKNEVTDLLQTKKRRRKYAHLTFQFRKEETRAYVDDERKKLDMLTSHNLFFSSTWHVHVSRT